VQARYLAITGGDHHDTRAATQLIPADAHRAPRIDIIHHPAVSGEEMAADIADRAGSLQPRELLGSQQAIHIQR
jgi:hypothetical protein